MSAVHLTMLAQSIMPCVPEVVLQKGGSDITILSSLSKIFTSVPSILVYQQKSKLNLSFLIFFFFLKQVFLFLNFMHFASATETPAYLEDVSHFYLKMLNNFISYFRIGCGKRWDDMSVDGTIPSSYRRWCY